MKIVPIILAHSVEEFQFQADKIADLSNRINIDVSDEIVTKKATLNLEQVLVEIKNNPKLNTKKLDFDFMVKDWLPLVELLTHTKDLNINSVVIHQKYLKKLPFAEFDLGVALDLDDPVNFRQISKFSLIQIMTVELGSQGSSFHPEALTKITELRQNGFDGQITIDGGVSDSTLPLILKNKGLPDIVGVGSFFTKAASPVENCKILESIINKYSF